MKRAQIKIINLGLTLLAEHGQTLGKVLSQADIPVRFECGQKGVCGKCQVKIISGSLSPPDRHEKYFLEFLGLDPSVTRLACLARITQDLEIEIPEESLLQPVKILDKGITTTFPLRPSFRQCFITLDKEKVTSSPAINEAIAREINFPNLVFSLETLNQLGEAVRETPQKLQVTIFQNKEICSIESDSTPSPLLGVAIDLGTTTVVGELINLENGETLAVASGLNQQLRFGSDVVARLYEATSSEARKKSLQRAAGRTINSLLNKLTKRPGISRENIMEVVVAGNTVMNHLLLGLPAHTLARLPFAPVFQALPELNSSELGLNISPWGKVYVAPNIQSFIGGDISAGLLACRLFEKSGRHLYLDLGTNGEIIINDHGELWATSTAAGPAFEGVGLSSGMMATTGAIYQIKDVGSSLEVKTIGRGKPRGICGTGFVDLLSIALRQKWIRDNGRITNRQNKIEVRPQVGLGQEDIRKLQMALAAIKTGVKLLMSKLKLDYSELDTIYLAGAFGTELNIHHAMDIGLLPQIDPAKVVFIGNASLAGARCLLLNYPLRKKLTAWVKKIKFLSLAQEKEFQDTFLKSLNLEPFPQKGKKGKKQKYI